MSQSEAVKRELVSFGKEFLFALVVAMLITRFIFIIPTVPTGSMIPTIKIDERVLVDKISVHFQAIERGEIVVFPYPDNPDELFIKRVIGLPGETVEVYGEKVYINGQALDEPYLSVRTLGTDGPFEVPEGHIFVMGDNRNESNDSRRWRSTHYVALSDVQGRGIAVLWPLNALRWLR